MEVLSIFDVFLEAENSPLLEVDGLANNLSENVGVIEVLACWLESALGLCLGAREHENAWSLKDLSFDLIGLKIYLKFPLFDFLGIGDHAIQI